MDDDGSWLQRWVAEDAARVRQLLARLVATCGVTRRELDHRLGRGRGYTSMVLNGEMALKLEHVTAILLALGMHPGPVYQFLYPTERPIGSVAATPDVTLRLTLAGVSANEPPTAMLPPAGPPMTAAEVQALIDQSLERAFAAQRARRSRRKKKPPAKRRPD